MNNLKIWTDGSYRASVDIGGIGVVMVQDDKIIQKISKKYEHTTNNKMEILAIVTALNYLPDSIDSLIIFTDSQYCLGIINQGWKRNKNIEEWHMFDKALLKAKQQCRSIRFQFTKGHDFDDYNNMADELATIASGYRKVHGGEPTELPPRDEIKPEEQHKKSMIFALDFDGTVVKHKYPDIGEDIGAVPVLLALQNNGHQFILYTMRDNHSSGRNCLKEAADWFHKNHINLIGINCNPWQSSWTDSPKVYAPVYIDDAALGAPLTKTNPAERPYIDWKKCVDIFADKGWLTTEQAMTLSTIVK